MRRNAAAGRKSCRLTWRPQNNSSILNQRIMPRLIKRSNSSGPYTTLLNEVLSRLEDEYRREGKIELFNAIKQTLAGTRESQPYTELAARLNEVAVRMAGHRLRKRYRELLQTEIANTVSSPAEVKEEMNHLFKVMSGG